MSLRRVAADQRRRRGRNWQVFVRCTAWLLRFDPRPGAPRTVGQSARRRLLPHVHSLMSATSSSNDEVSALCVYHFVDLLSVDGRCSRTGFTTSPVVRRLSATRTWEFSREQAHVPTQQPSSRQDARLPPAHAYARRPGHPCRSPAQGPQPSRSLTRAEPECSPAPIDCAGPPTSSVSSGVVDASPARTVVVHRCPRRRRPRRRAKVGFVVSKAVGNAVTRNRVKRRLRAAVSPAASTASPGHLSGRASHSGLSRMPTSGNSAATSIVV